MTFINRLFKIRVPGVPRAQGLQARGQGGGTLGGPGGSAGWGGRCSPPKRQQRCLVGSQWTPAPVHGAYKGPCDPPAYTMGSPDTSPCQAPCPLRDDPHGGRGLGMGSCKPVEGDEERNKGSPHYRTFWKETEGSRSQPPGIRHPSPGRLALPATWCAIWDHAGPAWRHPSLGTHGLPNPRMEEDTAYIRILSPVGGGLLRTLPVPQDPGAFLTTPVFRLGTFLWSLPTSSSSFPASTLLGSP